MCRRADALAPRRPSLGHPVAGAGPPVAATRGDAQSPDLPARDVRLRPGPKPLGDLGNDGLEATRSVWRGEGSGCLAPAAAGLWCASGVLAEGAGRLGYCDGAGSPLKAAL